MQSARVKLKTLVADQYGAIQQSTCPPATAFLAGPPPLKGTTFSWIFARSRKTTVAACAADIGLETEAVKGRFDFLAASKNSSIVLYGESFLTRKTFGSVK
jgi:hypothetical protein